MLHDRNIVVCVSGGIAAYKACDLVSKLVQNGCNVKVMMTENATKFVSPLTFQALSRNEVFTNTFVENNPKEIAHIALSDWADFFIIAPATANLLAKLSFGLADDMITTTLLATKADIYVCPAMNVHMYENEAVQENMKKLQNRGYRFIEPKAGYLACGYVGKGRLEEPLTIINVIEDDLHNKNILKGKKILISAGPTEESIDPVRYLTNRSSGKMGFALAETAARLGAEVTLVTGPVHLEVENKEKISRIDVETASEMYDQMHRFFGTSDIVIKAAAVSDYRPKNVLNQKMKKSKDEMILELVKNDDILKSLGKNKKKQFLIGFAAETNDVLKYGKEKLKEKNLDAIIINNVLTEGAGFNTDTNIVTYMNKSLETFHFSIAKKEVIAKQILERAILEMKGE